MKKENKNPQKKPNKSKKENDSADSLYHLRAQFYNTMIDLAEKELKEKKDKDLNNGKNKEN